MHQQYTSKASFKAPELRNTQTHNIIALIKSSNTHSSRSIRNLELGKRELKEVKMPLDVQ